MNEKSKSAFSFRIPLFCLVTMCFWFSMYTYVPTFGPYVESLGATHKMAGVILGSYGFTQMILRIPIGILSDRIRKRKVFIIIGLFFAFFSSLGLLFTQNLAMILLFRSLAGVAAAAWVSFTVLYSSYYSPGEATKAIGTISFFNSLSQMLAMLLGGKVAQLLDWSASFKLGAVVGILGFAGSFFLIEKFEDNVKPIALPELLKVMGDRTLLTVSFLAILSQILTFSTVYGFIPVYAKSEIKADAFQMSLMTVFSTLSTAIAQLIGVSFITKKVGDRRTVVFGFVLMGLSILAVPLTKGFWTLILSQVFTGFGRGLAFTLLMGLSIKNMSSDKRSTAMGFFQAVYGIGMVLGPVIMGMIGDWVGLKPGFVFIGILGFVTAVLAGRIIQGSGRESQLQ